MPVVEIADRGKKPAHPDRQTTGQTQGFNPGLLQFDRYIAILDNDRHREHGGELVVHVGRNIDLGFAQ